MLNIFTFLKKKDVQNIEPNKGNIIRSYMRNLPASKEWYNSVYAFDKNCIRFLPAVHNYVFKLLKAHFNMNDLSLTEKKTRKLKKLNRISGRKVWVSTPEIKHLNEKITITVYIYNKIYNLYKKEINQLEFKWGPKLFVKSKIKNFSYSISKSDKILRNEYPTYLGINKKNSKVSNKFYVKIINWLKWDITKLYKTHLRTVNNKANALETLNLLKIERHNYLINQFKRELSHIKLKKKMLFDLFKFNDVNLAPIIKFLQLIYKKKVEFNIVTLKHYYLSSSILSQILVSKISNGINRGKAYIPVDKSFVNIKIPNLSGKKIINVGKEVIGKQNIVLNSFISKEKKDYLNEFLLIDKKSDKWSGEKLEELVLSNLENKSVSGVFIKASGRLTKRYKAQRAITKFKYKGTLKNVYSAHRGYPSALSRGYNNINVEKTLLHSKIRIGAYGLTGWVASY
jgi:hypothetical protein